MSVKRQLSFAAGEISKEFYGRPDQIRNQTGLATCRNFLVDKSGGVKNRPGTQYQSTIFQPTLTCRTKTWRFSDAQTYKLEFSNLRLAFWLNGSPILQTAVNITAATKASPCELTTSGSHGYSVGDKVYLSALGGMSALNGRYYKVRTVPSATTLTLSYSGDGTADGTAVDSSSFTTYTSGGTAERVYSITTPYTTADLRALQFAQSADVMVITHSTYAPRKLTRTAHAAWTLEGPTYGPSTTYPTGGSVSTTSPGTTIYRYMVTSQNEATGIESLSGTAHEKTVSSVTKATEAVVTTSAPHEYETGCEVQFPTTFGGMIELAGRRFRIEVTGASTFKLTGEDSTSYATFTSGTVALTNIIFTTGDAALTVLDPNVVVTNAAATAGVRYNIYKELGGIFGFIGSTYSLTFNDSGFTPDTFSSVPIYREPFRGSENYPSACAFYQGRLVLGGTESLPNGADASVVGDSFNFTIHSPSQDSDAVRFTTAGYVDQLKHMAPLDRLVCFTAGAEFIVAGGGEGSTMTPTEANARPRTYNGSGDLFPLLIDSNVIFRPGSGTSIFDFHYEINVGESGGYQSADRLMFSNHLLKGHTVVDWAYQRSPDSVIWMVREDGVLLSMTYVPGQQLYGPATHDLHGGTVENVSVVREGDDEDAEDVLYLVVARELEDGSTTRYVERLASRQYTDVEDAVFVDSAKTYDGTGTGTATLSGSGWTNATALTCTFSVAQTTATVGNEVQLNGEVQIRCRITGVTSTTVVTVVPHTTVPASMRATAVSDWRMAVDTLTGLHHLEGQTVSVWGDRVVVASALNPAYDTTYEVTDGAIVLLGDQRYGLVTIGLPITADLYTLDTDPAEDGKFAHKTKNIGMVAVRIAESRSFYAGAKKPSDDDDDPIEFLYEPKIRRDETYEEPMALTTGIAIVRTKSTYNRTGRVFLRVMDPAPVTVLGVAAIGMVYEG